MSKEFQYINDYYNVPACSGRRIRFEGKKEGVITKDLGNYIGVVFDGDKATKVSALHPTNEVEYLGMGEAPKMTAGQMRYQEYLEYDGLMTFSEWLGIKPKCKCKNSRRLSSINDICLICSKRIVE